MLRAIQAAVAAPQTTSASTAGWLAPLRAEPEPLDGLVTRRRAVHAFTVIGLGRGLRSGLSELVGALRPVAV